MFTIYHIPGIKIGCSNEVDDRVEDQGFDYYEVLETHEDIYVASRREIELQKEYGLPVDRIPYYVVCERGSNGGKIGGLKGGKIVGLKAGKIAVESGQLRSVSTKEVCSKGGRVAANKPYSPNKLKVTCPHCGKIGAQFIMGRWHFDKCKHKK